MTTRTPRSVSRPFTPPPPPPPFPGGNRKSAMKTPVPPPRSRSGNRPGSATPISAAPFDALSRKDMAVSPERAALMADIRNKPPLRRLEQSQIRDFSSPFPITGNLSPHSPATRPFSPVSSRPYSASPDPPTRPSSSGSRMFRPRDRSSTRDAPSRSDVLSPVRSPSRANYDSVLGVGLYPSAEKLFQQGPQNQRQRQQSTHRSAQVTPTPRPESALNGRKREAPKPPGAQTAGAPWISPLPNPGSKKAGGKWESYQKNTLYSVETKSCSSRSQSHSGPRNPTFFEAAVLDVFDQVGKPGQTVTTRTRGPAPVSPQLHSGGVKSYLRSNTNQNSDFHTRFALHLNLDVEMILPPNFTGMKKTYPSLQRFIDDSVL